MWYNVPMNWSLNPPGKRGDNGSWAFQMGRRHIPANVKAHIPLLFELLPFHPVRGQRILALYETLGVKIR